jgi:hypothetical protein
LRYDLINSLLQRTNCRGVWKSLLRWIKIEHINIRAGSIPGTVIGWNWEGHAAALQSLRRATKTTFAGKIKEATADRCPLSNSDGCRCPSYV